MPADIIGLILVFIALFALALQRLYSSVPVKELKRLAARGEHLAAILYRPVAYGTSLRVLLWLIAGICLPVGFLLLAQNLPITVSLLIMMAALAIGAIWLPNQQLSLRSARIAAWAAPSLEWVLHHTHRPLNTLAEHINGRRTLTSHSGLYEKDDFQALLAQQQVQEDNRIDPSEIELMQRALHFSDTKAAEIAIPRKDAPMLSTSDALGPILFDELHKSGQQFFIVYRSKPDNVVGMLALKDAKHSKKGGTVADIMMTDLCFVGEDFSLPQIARAFVATGQQVAVVINKFEEFVGIISFNRLMEFLFTAQMTDQPAVQYEDRAAVASYKALTAVTDQPAVIPEEEITSSPEVSEVVE